MLLSILGAFLAIWSLRTALWLFHARRLPPGPPRHLILDNRGDMVNRKENWKSIHKWHKEFGSVISFYLGRRLFVSLGSLETSTALLDKRGGIYSSRPRSIMSNEILSKGMRGLGMPYGQKWRNWRWLMHSSLSIEASAGYKALQCAESKVILRDILDNQADPRQFPAILRRYAVSVVTVVSYGRRIKSLDDHLVVKQQKIEEYFIQVNVPGKFLVELFPILLWLPKPLQWFRREPEAHFARDSKFLTMLVDEVKDRMAKGIAYPSTATRAREKQGAFGLNDLETAYALAAPFGAGAGTTLATIDWFLLAMLLHPEAMKKAQEELDRVIGHDRLPDFDDATSLPYIDAIIKETMRWRPIVPIGVPHSVTEEDIYKGQSIPGGTTIIGNIYSITQDEELFPDPNAFRPERYVEDSSLASSFVFGFGRRICPGMHVARNSLFILVSRLLWTFDILPPLNSIGVPILPSPDDVLPALVVKPKPFEFLLVPRRKDVETIVRAEAQKAEGELAAYD